MTHLSDQEQVQLLKNWWKKYGIYVLLGLLAFLISSYGLRYWHTHQAKRAELASIVYSEMLNLRDFGKKDQAELLANNLLKEYKNTPYASFVAFLQAKDAVNAGKLPIAVQKLHWILEHNGQASLRQLARLRLARVLLAEKKAAPALFILKRVEDQTFLAGVIELRGDADLLLGKRNEAKSAYTEALQINQTNKIATPLLRIKLQQLSK